VRRIRIKDALGSALVIFAATPPVFAVAQPNDVVRDITGPAAGVSTTAGTLAPAEIVTEVRRAGFEPISRPVQHGRVYVLLALDPYGMDVKLTVDADSGRVLWATGIIGARYGGAAYYSYHPLSRYERPPIPPADIPNMGPGKINSGSVRSSASTRSSRRCRAPARLTSPALWLRKLRQRPKANPKRRLPAARMLRRPQIRPRCPRPLWFRSPRWNESPRWNDSQRAPRNDRGALCVFDARHQADYAAALAPMTLPFWVALMRMVRGFMASGSSRTKSMCNRPFSNFAAFTSTKSASRNTRSNALAAMP